MEEADLRGAKSGFFAGFSGGHVSEARINGMKYSEGSSDNECLMMYRQ